MFTPRLYRLEIRTKQTLDSAVFLRNVCFKREPWLILFHSEDPPVFVRHLDTTPAEMSRRAGPSHHQGFFFYNTFVSPSH